MVSLLGASGAKLRTSDSEEQNHKKRDKPSWLVVNAVAVLITAFHQMKYFSGMTSQYLSTTIVNDAFEGLIPATILQDQQIISNAENITRPALQLADLLETNRTLKSIYPSNDIRSLYHGANIDAVGLQPWLKDYLQWHGEMRQKFPGSLLLDHPDAPKVLIKVCLGMWNVVGPDYACGGLHDRFKSIPGPVYMAAQTNRVLLYKWFHPYPLEEFLPPNFVNWTVPENSTSYPLLHDSDFLKSKHIPLKGKDTFQKLRDDPNLQEQKIVTFTKLEGGESTTYIAKDRQSKGIPEASTEFGILFHLFFKPAPAIETELTQFMQEKGLAINNYVATHCRVTHPSRKSILKDSNAFTSKNGGNQNPDDVGLLFEGKTKDMMIDVGTHAINCTNRLRANNSEPIYFFSDSDDLVHYMATPPTASSRGSSTIDTTTLTLSERRSDEVKTRILPGRVVGRDLTNKGVAHLDGGQGADATNFYGTFIDLYLGIGARCVSFGIGNYAYLATLISNTQCLQTHERLPPHIAGRWGTDLRKLKGEICPIPNFYD